MKLRFSNGYSFAVEFRCGDSDDFRVNALSAIREFALGTAHRSRNGFVSSTAYLQIQGSNGTWYNPGRIASVTSDGIDPGGELSFWEPAPMAVTPTRVDTQSDLLKATLGVDWLTNAFEAVNATARWLRALDNGIDKLIDEIEDRS